MSEEKVLAAIEAVVEQVYKTAESELSYFTKLVEIGKDKVTLSVFMPKTGRWKSMEVLPEYKIRELNATEQEAFTAVKEKKPRAPKDPNAPKREPVKKAIGQVNGLNKINSWAFHIAKNIDLVGGRSLVIAGMLADFPGDGEGINRWADAYRTYYNTGRFEKQGIPRQAITKVWLLSPEEKAAGVYERKPRELGVKKEKPAVATPPVAA